MGAVHYEHSTTLPLTGVLFATLIGFVSAAAMGVAYSYASYYIGYVEFNWILAALLGALTGVAVATAARIGHLRSTAFPTSVAFLAAIVALYFAWAADRLVRLGAPNGRILDAFEPGVLAEYVKYFYEKGLWTIKEGVGANNNPNAQPVKRIALACCWAAEAMAIILSAVVTTWDQMRNLLYCEKCEQWLKLNKNICALNFPGDPTARDRIASGDLELPLWQGAATYFTVDLATCESCPESNYVTVKRVTRIVDKKGKVKEKTKALVRHVAIGPDEVGRLRQMGPNC